MLKGDGEGLNSDGKVWKGDWETLERIWAFHCDGKAFKDDGKEQEQEHCIQSKIANQPYNYSYDISILVENNIFRNLIIKLTF